MNYEVLYGVWMIGTKYRAGRDRRRDRSSEPRGKRKANSVCLRCARTHALGKAKVGTGVVRQMSNVRGVDGMDGIDGMGRRIRGFGGRKDEREQEENRLRWVGNSMGYEADEWVDRLGEYCDLYFTLRYWQMLR